MEKIPLTELLNKEFREFWDKINSDLPHLLSGGDDCFEKWFDQYKGYDIEDFAGILEDLPYSLVIYLFEFGFDFNFDFSNNHFGYLITRQKEIKLLAEKILVALLQNPERYKYIELEMKVNKLSNEDANMKNINKAYKIAESFFRI